MVGVIEPNPGARDPPPPPEEQLKWWDRYSPIVIRIPAQGAQSPKTDEVCVTWCSQTARRRADGQDPWCRSVCLRRVFAHEVNSVLSQSHTARSAGGQNSGYPLPPEGQPPSAIVDGIVGGPNRDGRPSATDVQYWQEGFYVWFTKNRWAAQEKIDLMMLDLARQTGWIRTKEQEERAWFDSQMQRVRSVVQSANDANRGGEQHNQYPENDGNEWYQEPTRHPYPDAAKESILFKVPSSILPFNHYSNKIVLPTKHLLDFVKESIDSGAQQQFARRAWDTVKSGAPLVLAKNVVATCWEAFMNEDGPEKK